jgi:hypothetical protein
MRGKVLVEALVSLAQSRGITVRKETMSRGTSAGGFCVVKGVATVLVDERGSVDAQVEVLAGVLRRMTWELDGLDPAVRAVLERSPGEKRAKSATSAPPANPVATRSIGGGGRG